MSKISIIVPIYNVAPYLRQCLDSVASQTYKDLEVLLVDDCGADDSMEIAESFVTEYSGPIKFSIIHHERNKGLSAARNTGIYAASGDYVYFLDSDDMITPDCIESLAALLVDHPDSEIVFAGAMATGPESAWMDYSKKNLPDYSNNAIWIKAMMLRRFVFSMTAWNRLVNREFIISNNLFFEEGYIHEDEIWNFRLSHCVKRASVCKKNTYYYNVRQEGIMLSRSVEKLVEGNIVLCKRLLQEIQSPLVDEQVISIWNICSIGYEIKDLPSGKIKEFRGILRELLKYCNKGLGLLLRIYIFSPALFNRLHSLPKFKGYINIKLKCNYVYL